MIFASFIGAASSWHCRRRKDGMISLRIKPSWQYSTNGLCVTLRVFCGGVCQLVSFWRK